MSEMEIGVVIVTYNRIELLKKALVSYEIQEKKPKYVLVVNNNSNDGTKEFLTKWKQDNEGMDKYVLQLEANIGGSGGFHKGLEMAMKLDAEWIWVGDDDAFPEKDAFLKAEENLKVENNENIVAICGKVLNCGKIDLPHRRRIKKELLDVKEISVDANEYLKKSFYLDEFSYVGTMMKKEVLKEVGITKEDYFIYYDDTEHSLRIREKGDIVCFPNIVINHNVGEVGKNINWKNYYGYRNLLDVYRKHFDRRYYIYRKNKFRIISIIMKDRKHAKVIRDAIRDCERRNFGVSINYKPGAKL